MDKKPPRRDPQQARTESLKRDEAFFRAREEERRLGEEKTARLRALRLAKEATDREQAIRDAANAIATKKKRPRVPSPQ